MVPMDDLRFGPVLADVMGSVISVLAVPCDCQIRTLEERSRDKFQANHFDFYRRFKISVLLVRIHVRLNFLKVALHLAFEAMPK